MRIAVGAGRGRLITQLMIESLLIALAGAVLGLAVGYGAITLFRQIQLPTDLPVALTFQLDRRALLFSLIVAGLSAMLFGLAPAIQASRADLAMVMKTGEAMVGRRRRWGRSLLVGGQVATSVVLLVLATFMYRGFQGQIASGPGLSHRSPADDDPRPEPRALHRGRRAAVLPAARRTRAIGARRQVRRARLVCAHGHRRHQQRQCHSRRLPAPGRQGQPRALLGPCGRALLRQRCASPSSAAAASAQHDSTDAPRVAVVNEEYVKHYLPNQDPIGKRFELRERGASSWVEIVGVAKTAKYLWLGEPDTEFVYLPFRQYPRSDMVLLTESAGDPRAWSRRYASWCRASIARCRSTTCGRWRSSTGCGRSDLQRDHRHRRGDGPDGPGPRHRRPLRPGRVCHDAADEGDRHPHGDRRRPDDGVADGPPPGTRARCRRSRPRPARRPRRQRLLQAAFPSGDDRASNSCPTCWSPQWCSPPRSSRRICRRVVRRGWIR